MHIGVHDPVSPPTMLRKVHTSEFQMSRLSASGADDLFIHLEPTERLMELVTASLAGKIEGRIT